MISREDFVFTIGYDGSTAIVDGRAKKEYGKLGTMELAAKGLYRAAFASALRAAAEGKGEDMAAFLAFFNEKARSSYTTAEQLKRLFGVNEESVTRTLVLG
ncbi:MAG TPA: hypothetical protein PLB91_14270 [Spirochaetales bacterium]|nr:hypothetical protein [Spirochaetales bacterium]HRY54845.1 hypothetical protein [Spirochaetia bacterium]HRZ66276.1 hypothetical protein [Spirochaetia bacterium]